MLRNSVLYFVILSAVFNVYCYCVLVTTDSGPIEGRLVEYNGIYYLSYQGIPYAEPPVGDLRFKPPKPKVPWTSVLDATADTKPVCPQAEGDYSFSEMSEDCLFLNVYVPTNFTDGVSLPVLVYYPGGEFKSKSGKEGDYGPQLLMRYGIILVTLNYRLGAAGFLSLNLESATGNAGLKDAAMALKWTYQNILFFGGNPDRITIGGQSAGSVVAQYLTLTTTTQNLFQQAILESGSAIGYRFFTKDQIKNAFGLGSQLGIQTSNATELLKQLKQRDIFDIVTAQEAMGDNNKEKAFRPYTPFIPVAEIESTHAFITEEPWKIVKSDMPQNVPVMIGFNNEDGLKMYPVVQKDFSTIDDLNDNFERCIPSDIPVIRGSEKSKSIAQSIKEFYFSGKNISESNIDHFYDLITDTQFSHSIDLWIRIQKQKKNSNRVYYYVFSFDGELNWGKIKNNVTHPGADHADDLGYLFYTNVTKDILPNIDSRTKTMLDTMLTLWSNFVKFGSPTPCNKNNVGFRWAECKYPQLNYLILGEDPTNSPSAPIRERTLFWQNIYDKYYQA